MGCGVTNPLNIIVAIFTMKDRYTALFKMLWIYTLLISTYHILSLSNTNHCPYKNKHNGKNKAAMFAHQTIATGSKGDRGHSLHQWYRLNISICSPLFLPCKYDLKLRYKHHPSLFFHSWKDTECLQVFLQRKLIFETFLNPKLSQLLQKH